MAPADVRGRLLEQGAPASHLERLAALISLAELDDGCRAIALVGSFAKGSGDRISDLDLVMFVRDDHGARFLDETHKILERQPILNQFLGRHPKGGSFRKYVYLDFSSVELHVFEPSSPFRLREPYLSVWDPDELLPTLVIPGAPVRHEDFAAYEYGDAGLVWELVDCIKWLARGKVDLAKGHLRKLVAQMDAGDRED